MKRCVVDKVDQCVVIRLVSENKENRLNFEFVQDFHKALDEVERYSQCMTMVHGLRRLCVQLRRCHVHGDCF